MADYKTTYNRKKALRRRKKRIRAMLWTTLLLLIAAIIVLIVVVAVRRNATSGATTDIESYYKLNADPATEREAAEDDEMAIILNGKILEDRAINFGSRVYVSRDLLKKNIDSRFYYDRNEQILLFANAQDIYTVTPEESDYLVNDEVKNDGFVPAFFRNDKLYIALDFADDLTFINWSAYGDPGRVVIDTEPGTKQYVDTKAKTAIRVLGGPKSDIVTRLDKEVSLQVIEDLDDWYGVISDDGWKGYVDVKSVGDIYTEELADTHSEPEYTKLTFGQTIKLGWGGVYMAAGNSLYYDLVEYAGDEMNVYCPTWYYLEDNYDGISIYSDYDYVEMAHNDGYSVWALFADSNVDYDFVEDLLTHTTQRHEMIDLIMDDMEEKGIEGLNLDFERIMSDYGDDFIQFVREFSIRCRKAGKFFTVDNYAPYDYNACYHIEEQGQICDYVMLMAYDDYLGTGNAGPNSSLPFIEEVTELAVSKVDSSRLVVGLPFYSRLWFEQGNSLRKEEYNMSRARSIAEDNDADISWNSTLGLDEAEFYYDPDSSGDDDDDYYSDDDDDDENEISSGREKVYAWLESKASYEAKLNLLRNYDLAGIAFWTLGQEDEDVWEAIATFR